MTILNLEQVAALGYEHAKQEALKNMEALLATMAPNPVYEFPTIGKCFKGWDNTVYFYTQFFANFSPKVCDTTLLNQWVNEQSVVQEYDVTLDFGSRKETHRILGALMVDGDKLGGERVYTADAMIRHMVGDMYDSLEPLS